MNGLLPTEQVLHLGLYGGWGLVLTVLAVMGLQPWRKAQALSMQHQWALLGGLWIWILLPLLWSPMWSPVYWLGLSFQTPSLTSMALCAIGLVRFWRYPSSRYGVAYIVPAAVATVLGWILFLDSFALLPMSLYAWGVESTAVPVVAALALLPLAMHGLRAPLHTNLCAGVAVGVVVVFVTLRMPTGNLWDAVLDPLLWLVAQGYCIQYIWSRR